MKIGLSSYCFSTPMLNKNLTLPDMITWVGRSAAEHLEIALPGLTRNSGDLDWNLDDDPDLFDAIRTGAARAGVELSGVCMGASFIGDPGSTARQISRVKHHLDLTDQLGIRFFRHDVTPWALRPDGVADIEANLPTIVAASQEIAQYAARYDITTSIENHGYFINGSERVRRVLAAVDEPNFKTTLDVGNFLCVDEDPLLATRLNLPYASNIQLKDFYLRDETFAFAGEDWLRTAGGRYLLGATLGYGDLPLSGICTSITAAGYDGHITIEYEGPEDPFLACTRGLANARALLRH